MALNVRRNWSFGRVPEIPERVYDAIRYPFARTIKVMQFPNVRAKQALNLCQRQRGQQLPSVQIMLLDFPKDQGLP